MRWPSRKPDEDGDTRKRRGFLFLPKSIGGMTRWLEFAVWTQVYHVTWDGGWWLDHAWEN